jgi:hypothetical protein
LGRRGGGLESAHFGFERRDALQVLLAEGADLVLHALQLLSGWGRSRRRLATARVGEAGDQNHGQERSKYSRIPHTPLLLNPEQRINPSESERGPATGPRIQHPLVRRLPEEGRTVGDRYSLSLPSLSYFD